MVLAAEYFVFVVGSRGDRARRIRGMARDRERTRGAAVPRNHRSFPAGLSRTLDLEFPLYRSAFADDLAGGRGALNPCFYADGNAGDAADHFRLHDFRLLDFQRKVARGRRVSLSPQVLWKMGDNHIAHFVCARSSIGGL